MLIEKIGSSNVTLFDMGEMIREALAYIDTTNTKEEVADPKAKKGAKGGASPD